MDLPLAIVAAVAENGVIGRDNRLIWRLRTDLRRFRDLTWGKPMIMGRKTFASIGKALPGRRTVVLTRDRDFSAEDVDVAHDWDEALARAGALAGEMGATEIAVAGGAEIYALALPFARRLYLTLVHASPEGDTVFPAFDRLAFRERRREDRPKGPDDEHPFTFVDLERRSSAASR
ncbi:MAG TPA: dihydrofolate reductase [Beijerinckiaceae bacterium]|jgi:dihydrofolate reductase